MRIGLLVLLCMVPLQVAAGQQRATLSGTVRDSSGRGIAAAEVSLSGLPSTAQQRVPTDSIGSFTIRNLQSGTASLRIRRLGYRSFDSVVVIRENEGNVAEVVLSQSASTLDTVRVVGQGKCVPFSVEGFACRRQFARGVFLDMKAIDSSTAIYPAGLFEGMPGLRVIPVQASAFSAPLAVVSTAGWRCLSIMLDGRPPGPSNWMPMSTRELYAVEVYTNAHDVPRELERFMWKPQRGGLNAPCALIMYWTSGGYEI